MREFSTFVFVVFAHQYNHWHKKVIPDCKQTMKMVIRSGKLYSIYIYSYLIIIHFMHTCNPYITIIIAHQKGLYGWLQLFVSFNMRYISITLV